MVRIELSIDLQYEVAPPGADFVFNIHCAHTRSQILYREQLQISQQVLPQIFTDPVTHNRYLRLSAWAGPLTVSYSAVVDLHHHLAQPDQIAEVPVSRLPPEVLSYIYPSRYCQSDRLGPLVMAEFGTLPQGYGRVVAIQDWVRRRVRFESNTTNSNTSALDTLNDGRGVCRDFAHLMIALCRALNIPARFATGIDFGSDPILGPTDFHAYVEVFLGGRWYIFDPSNTAIPMGFVRFGTGRDAADVSFATIFGSVQSPAPRIQVKALQEPLGQWEIPWRRPEAISTDAPLSWP
ncbi:MAG: transglutaminase family protein [Aquabacterium sp.]|uniref:transglutaminase-like domain-containing protein n=1 Tax=Aquabacterium sp. TaxID=1872578 RepID=UPI0025BB8320|nr:transglutaminase family protein [Aquabacterium sp.]MBI5924330.1 transglutaminase family protein [Aquabacterium sp.]